MAMESNNASTSYSYFLIILLLTHCINLVLGDVNQHKAGDWSVPAIFVLGDSAVDVGTNNFIEETKAIAIFPYYGIDYPDSVPTGRFSNGFNIADQIAMLFGFPESPPSFFSLLQNMSTFKERIKFGINFASAGAGLQDQTGEILWVKVVTMTQQIEQFATVRGNLTEHYGEEFTKKFIAESLHIFCLGANDILDHKRINSTVPVEKFMPILDSNFTKHVQNMYNLGARKFGIMGIPPIGCWPYTRAMNSSGGCLKQVNMFARALRTTMETRLLKMSKQLPNLKYSYGDTYTMTKYAFRHAHALGFKETKTACCGNGRFHADVYCYEPSNPYLCKNRTEYFFWDLYHPSQYATALAAATLFMGDTQFNRPISLSQLAEAKLHPE